MAVDQVIPNEQRWPAVALAYDLGVKSSYELMLKRFEIVEGRVRALVTMTATLTIGAPVFIATIRGVKAYDSWFLCAALAVALGILIAGGIAWTTGDLLVINPSKLTATEAVRLTAFQFKQAALQTAADDFGENRRALERKIRFADGITYALLTEVVLMIGWAVTGL